MYAYIHTHTNAHIYTQRQAHMYIHITYIHTTYRYMYLSENLNKKYFFVVALKLTLKDLKIAFLL